MVFAALVGMALIQGPSTPMAGMVVAEDGTPVVGADLVLTGSKPGEAPVVGRGKSGEGGRFRFDRPADLAPTNPYLVPTLWAYAPGHRVAVMKYAGAFPGADEPVRVVLDATARTEVRVESPDGAPVSGARVSVQGTKSSPSMPEPISDLTERSTGPDGVAVVDAFNEVTYVDVIAKGYGTQPRRFDVGAAGPRRVALVRPSGLRGRLVTEGGDPALAKGWKIRAWTDDNDGDNRTWRMVGYGETSTDDAGRFALAELAPGSLRLSVKPPGESDLLPEMPKAPAVRDGKETVLEIPLRRAATIAGRVVEHGTGKPVAGMQVHLFRPGASNGVSATTDAEGRFTLLSHAGKARLWGPTAPAGYVSAGGITKDGIAVPEGPGRVDAGTFELLRAAPPLRGEVRDEAGRPSAGVWVRAEWTASTPIGKRSSSSSVTTDARGGFALDGLASGARITITARGQDRGTAAPVVADEGAAGPVVVTIVPRATVAVAGRVLGPGGAPIAGAKVQVIQRDDRPGHPNFAMPVSQPGLDQIRTGPDGTFRSPKELDREDRSYQVEVVAPGYHPGRSALMPAGEGDAVTFPDLALRRATAIRAVTGRVIDREGRPVAGAAVSQAGDGPRRSATTTDDAGRFLLPGVYDGEALVFAEKDGLRFGGAVVGSGPGAIEVRLARAGEPPIAALKTLAPPILRAEERALGRALLAPVLAEARSGSLDAYNAKVIPALARLESDRVLGMIEDRVVDQPSAALGQVVLGQFEDDPRRAIATIEADGDPASRARDFLALADAVPAADPRRREFLDRALAETRRAAGFEGKIAILGQIADRWLDLGDVARATPILREGQAIVAGLPRNQYVSEVEGFAEVLAAIDLPAARAIFERKGMMNVSAPGPDEVRRHLGKALPRIAAIDPAEAERLLPEASGGPNLDDHDDLTFRVVVVIGRADPARARKLLGTIGQSARNPVFARPALAPFGLGLIAAGRAVTDPAGARALLDEAFAGLVAIERRRSSHSGPPESILMAALLPTVERIDPDRLAERLWLTASCRPPRPQVPAMNDVQAMASLGLLVSRYDRAMAGAIIAPALDRLPSLLDRTNGNGGNDIRVFEVLAAYDPRAIEALIRALPPAARRTERTKDGWRIVSSEALARLAAAEMLGQPIEARRRAALKQTVYGVPAWPEAR